MAIIWFWQNAKFQGNLRANEQATTTTKNVIHLSFGQSVCVQNDLNNYFNALMFWMHRHVRHIKITLPMLLSYHFSLFEKRSSSYQFAYLCIIASYFIRRHFVFVSHKHIFFWALWITQPFSLRFLPLPRCLYILSGSKIRISRHKINEWPAKIFWVYNFFVCFCYTFIELCQPTNRLNV